MALPVLEIGGLARMSVRAVCAARTNFEKTLKILQQERAGRQVLGEATQRRSADSHLTHVTSSILDTGKGNPMKRTAVSITAKIRILRPKLLLFLLASASLPALITSASVVAASDPPQATFSDADVEELTIRLRQLAVMQVANIGSVGNVDADGDSSPPEVHYLMSEYGLSADEAAAQFEAQAEASVASRWLNEELSDDARLGGMWIDHSRGGRLVVAITDAALGRELAAATSGLIPIDTKIVTATERDLNAIFSKVVANLDLVDTQSHRGTGVPYYSVSVELQDQRVVIGEL